MKYLVDANILSEATKPLPAAKVVAWLTAHEQDLVVNPIILGEIQFGILLMPAGARRRRAEQWFLHGIHKLHCVPIDPNTGLRWARLVHDLRRSGNSMPIKDSLIAATALTYDYTVATHNTRDFAKSGVKLIDPFDQ